MTSRRLTGVLTLVCCITASCPAAAQLIGTLFTSPEQREYLDYLRQDFLARSSERGFDISNDEIPEIPVAVAEAEEAEGPVIYTLGGIVSLRDGTQRIWLNGKTLGESELPPEARLVRDNGMPALRFTTASGNYLLRPGQTLTLESAAGAVIENYQRAALATDADDETRTAEDAASGTTVAAEEPDDVPEDKGDQTADGSEDAAPGSNPVAAEAETVSIEQLQTRLQMLEQAQFGSDDED